MQDFLKTIIKEAGATAKELFFKGVKHESKSFISDLVTEADYKVSDFLVEKIHEKYPDHHIFTEELDEPVNPGGEVEWVIDPIDGTRNFAMGIPFWCIIIAVQNRDEQELAAVYNPIADELFFAKAGIGAYMNDMPLHVNETDSLDYALGSFSRAMEKGTVYGTHIARYRKAADRINHETKVWTHQYGSVLAMCHLAAGGVDFYTTNAGLDHDYLAPVLISHEAGAIVTDSDGNPWQRGRQDIVVANPKLHPKVMELFK